MIDIENILKQLANKRPFFHSEADFQHALAWEIQTCYPKANIRIEKPYLIDDRPFYIDLIVEMDDKIIAIELKYKTKKFEFELNGENFSLKNQGAQGWGRYYFVNDIVRLEKLMEKFEISQGYAIFLTNDMYYQSKSKDNTVYFDFSLQNEKTLSGILKLKDEKKDR
ncbi:hypothetical protein [Moraxella nonliquefaciens]|uniref:hypothetical protein n=1 Tax=Moraxella nonliquefaciens TaxID=478 RepID=UPI003EE26BA1